MVNSSKFRMCIKFLSLASVFLLLAVVISCTSTAPSSVPNPGAPAAASAAQPAAAVQETGTDESGAAGTDNGGDKIAAADAGSQVDNETPVTSLPPGTPVEPAPEAVPALPEPEVPELPSLQDSTQASAPQTESPEPAKVPESQAPVQPQAEVPPVVNPPVAQAAAPLPPPTVPEQDRSVPEPTATQQVPPVSAPPQSKAPPSPPPTAPSFLKPAEKEIPPPVREQVPVPVNPLPELPAQTAPEPTGDKIAFSRVVRATVGQIVEIPFRGTGWVYLGELGNRRGINYESRRLDITPRSSGSAGTVEGQSFIFTADAAGTYILKFYKQDFIQDYIVNDYVQVIVGETAENSDAGRIGLPVDRGRVIAEPRWPPLPEPPSTTQSTAPAGTAEAAGNDAAVATVDVSPAYQSATPVSEPGPANQPAPAASAAPVPSSPPQSSSLNSSSLNQTQTGTPAGAAPTTGGQSSAPQASTVPPAASASQASSSAGLQNPPPVPVIPAPPPPGILSRPAQGNSDNSISAVSPPQAAAAVDPNQLNSAITDLINSNAAPSGYISRAKQEFDAGRIDSALNILNAMKQRYPSETDEAWWLYGQLLEANSSSRDIRQSLDYYRRLVNEYPQSPRAGDAQKRIAYLERYYINIR